MANHKSALKRIKTSEKARIANRQYRSKMRTAIKAVLSLENKENAESKLKEAVSILDRLAIRGIIHKNNSANQKSRLTRFVNSLT